MKVIAVTGTPGAGKTTIARRLAKKLGFYCLDANKLISSNQLAEGYDKKRKAKIVDTSKLNKSIIKEIKTIKNNRKILKYGGIIIDSHLSHFLPRKYINFCIVAKCNIKELNKRLKKRKYSRSKIQENLQAEIFDICYNEAIRKKHKVIIVETSKSFNISYIAKKLGC